MAHSDRKTRSQLVKVHRALLAAARHKAMSEHNDYILTLLKAETVGKEGLPPASVDSWNQFLGFGEGTWARFTSKGDVVFESNDGTRLQWQPA
jgi:hypothetical protein